MAARQVLKLHMMGAMASLAIIVVIMTAFFGDGLSTECAKLAADPRTGRHASRWKTGNWAHPSHRAGAMGGAPAVLGFNNMTARRLKETHFERYESEESTEKGMNLPMLESQDPIPFLYNTR